jgi:putative transferase (TIGR04331 family)
MNTINRELLMWARKLFDLLSQRFVRNTDAFIINSYLPKIEEIKLQIALGQFPQIWKSQVSGMDASVNHVLRSNLVQKMVQPTSDGLENITRELLFELLPICYLEGFKELNDQVNRLPWPRKPNFIFTSNNFDTDEAFKVWSAKKVDEGTKYITGQHGNNYGTHRFLNSTIEESTADKFLTWGWTDHLPQQIPAFIFKLANRANKQYDPLGGLLLIEVCLNHRITTWDGTSEFAEYFKDQLALVDKLASDARQTLTIRLHSEFHFHRWSEISRWKAFDPSLNIETGEGDIRDLIAQSRLVVHSYDSTGMLETLAQKIPTLAFWQNGFDHLRDGAKPYYQELIDAGIVHFSSDSLAQKVNDIWNDVDGWWLLPIVQRARKNFCEQYARVSKNPTYTLKKILMEIDGN